MSRFRLYFLYLASAVFLLSAPSAPTTADDYYVYVNWNPGVGHTTGVAGYVDNSGLVEDRPGEEYLFFTGGPSYGGHHTAYLYRVETAGNPEQHPSNPAATGSVAPRTFTKVSEHYMGNYSSGHENAFYVDDGGIYYGAAAGWAAVAGGAILHWDFDWNLLGTIVSTSAPLGSQTLARNSSTGDWWVGDANRRLFKWNGSSWVHQFTHPNLAGDHHDGMEIFGDSLFISDMTTDVIIQYRLDASGEPIDPPASPYKRFTYSAGPHVEGMGFGPNRHVWISGWSSGSIYELGGGSLPQPPVADAGEDQTVTAATNVTFDGSASFDTDGCCIEVFEWDIDHRDGVNFDAPDLTGETVTLAGGYADTYEEHDITVTLRVIDDEGLVSQDTLTVLVEPISSQSEELVRTFCDDRDPRNLCPGADCLCVDDSFEIVFDGQLEDSILEYDSFIPDMVIPARVVLGTVSEQIRGYAFGVTHNPADLSIVRPDLSIEDTASAEALNGGFTALRVVEGGFITAVVLNFTRPAVLPVGRNVVVKADYTLLRDVGARGTVLSFSEALGSPPAEVVLTVDRLEFPDFVDRDEGNCIDGIDNDQDGFTDREDEDCVVRNAVSRVPKTLIDGLVYSSQDFLRGDPNADGNRDSSDAVFILRCLFGGEACPTCFDAADCNDDGGLNVADPVYLLSFLFLGGPPPPEPFEKCDLDPTPDVLTCNLFPPCQ